MPHVNIGIHFKHALRSYYEPEMFPGLVYRPRNPKVTIMVFVSGKVCFSLQDYSAHKMFIRWYWLVQSGTQIWSMDSRVCILH